MMEVTLIAGHGRLAEDTAVTGLYDRMYLFRYGKSITYCAPDATTAWRAAKAGNTEPCVKRPEILSSFA
jgi:hypothetical protein